MKISTTVAHADCILLLLVTTVKRSKINIRRSFVDVNTLMGGAEHSGRKSAIGNGKVGSPYV